MSRVRIYELAKEAGIESKVLAEQLIELGYNIKSHSSTVEDTVADEIRSKILGTAKTEVVEKRISGKGGATVIRRRARTVLKEPVKITEKAEEKPVEAVTEAKSAAEVAEAAPQPTEKEITVTKAELDEKRPAEETIIAAEAETVPEPVAEQAITEQPSEEEPLVVTEEAPSEEEKKAAPVKAKPRRGLAKVIKKAAIQIPVEPAAKPARPKRAAAKGAAMPGRAAVGIPAETDKKVGKKKGKRLVQIQPEAEDRIRAKRPFAGKRKGRLDPLLNDEALLPRRGRYISKSGRGRAAEGQKLVQEASTPITEAKAIKKRIKVYETISVADIAHRMGVKGHHEPIPGC